MFEKNEPKYKYKKPSSPDEYIEAIYEELSEMEVKTRNKKTIKHYVYEILERQRESDFDKKRKSEQNDYNISWSLGFLAVIALILIFNGSKESSEFNWLQQNGFTLKVWGLALAILYIGVSIEKFSIFKHIWQFSFTKFIASIAISGLIVFSTGKAAGEINSVFGVDASAFPFTLTFTSGLVFFHYIIPFFVLVGIIATMFAFNALGWIRSKFSENNNYELPPIHSFFFPTLATIVLVTLWGWSKNDLSEEMLPSEIYKLAHMLDFNSKNECANLKQGVPFVYLGPNQTTILADTKSTYTENLKSFFEEKIDVPIKFYRLSCELVEPKSN
ncbi:hypothetical protein [Aeromonas veronii]|uniref:hypothetical protein n=1 Tax=Aeromonas veronii TaxID=654 RepID=UPI003D1ABBA6